MLVHKTKKALVLKVRDPNRITTLIPGARILANGMVAVKHGIDEVKVLNAIGVKAPSPIKFHYKWSGTYKPFMTQEETSAFLSLHHRAFCLSEIGTGKSLATLWAYDYLRSQGKAGKMIVVSPLSTLERTWGDELLRHFPHLNYSVLHGSRDKRLKLLAQDADIYIINHDGVEIILDAMKTRTDITHVVIDEISQCARNKGTNRWRALNAMVNKPIHRACWGLTGTPTPNAPTDAWAQCVLLVPDKVPAYFNRFKDSVMKQVGPFTWIPRPGALDIVKEAMQPVIRFRRDECVDLPPVLYETREVALSPEQKRAFKSMVDSLHVEFAEGSITAVNEAVKLSKLIQIICGIAYSTDGTTVDIPCPARMAEVLAIVEEASAKVLVFVPFVSAVAKVKEYLTSKNISVESIHGGVGKSERDRILKAFQHSPEPRVLVAQPATLSHGLTLTAANTIVWFAPITSNDIATQAEGRITRPGQIRNQFIIEIESTPLERKLYARLKSKQKTQGVLLDMIREEMNL